MAMSNSPRVAALICVVVLLGCGDGPEPSPASVVSTYEALSPPELCNPNFCATRRWGAGTVKNVGDLTAYDVRIHIRTACENYYVLSEPRSLRGGQSGTYETGVYYGCEAESVVVTWDEDR